jgi:hypothetical protein
MTMPAPPTLQEYVVEQLDRAISEEAWPTIQLSILTELRKVVEAWPNVLYLGEPMESTG